MRRLLLVLWWLVMPTAWAETTLTVAGRVDAGELTSEMKSAVSALEGLDEDRELQPGTTILTIRRLTGEFTPAEVAALEAALVAHDPTVREQRRASVQRDLASRNAKLKALVGLTDAELAVR